MLTSSTNGGSANSVAAHTFIVTSHTRSRALEYVAPVLLVVLVALLAPLLRPTPRPLHPSSDMLDELRRLHPSIAMPMLPDTVPVWLCLLLLALPLPAVLLYSWAWLKKQATEVHLHAAALCTIQTGCLQFALCELGKNMAVRRRPDFLSRCTAIVDGACVNPDSPYTLAEGFKSFPSGHSSAAFAGMILLSLVLMGRTRLWFAPRHRSFHKLLLCISPLALALWVAVSRTLDNRHHFTDVLCGAVIGSASACGVYFLHYPSVASAHSDEPLDLVSGAVSPASGASADDEFESIVLIAPGDGRLSPPPLP